MSPLIDRKTAKFSGAAADLTKVFLMVFFTASEASIMPSVPTSLLDFDDDNDGDDDDDDDVISRSPGQVISSWDACIRMDDAP